MGGGNPVGQAAEQINLPRGLQLRLHRILFQRPAERIDAARMATSGGGIKRGQQRAARQPFLRARLSHPRHGDHDVVILGQRLFHQSGQLRIAKPLPPIAFKRRGRPHIGAPFGRWGDG